MTDRREHDPGAELVDVVDDDGRVVGTVTRPEMRHRRLPHRVTYVLVFNPRGELFIWQRSDRLEQVAAFLEQRVDVGHVGAMRL